MQWETILRSVSAHRAYRWLYGAEISALKVAEFLILYRQMPRSLGFCCERMEEHLERIQRGYGEEAEAGRMAAALRSEEHTSELQSLMRISYAVFCLKKKIINKQIIITPLSI